VNTLTLRNVGAVTIEIQADAQKVKADALAVAKPILTIASDNDQQLAVNALKSLQTLTKQVEKSRTDVKGPVLAIGRQIDEEARKFVADLEAESKRLNKLITDYVVERQREAERAERARQAELARIEEEKRKAAAAEAARVAELARIEEEKRKAAEDAFLAETEEETQAAAEAAVRAREAEALERQRLEAEQQRQAELAREAAAKEAAIIKAPVKAAGQVVRKVAKFEVTDIAALYAARPHLVRIEPNTAAINGVLSSGVREIPGLRIWEEVQTQVR
jgi:chromosome segregation ATPase